MKPGPPHDDPDDDDTPPTCLPGQRCPTRQEQEQERGQETESARSRCHHGASRAVHAGSLQLQARVSSALSQHSWILEKRLASVSDPDLPVTHDADVTVTGGNNTTDSCESTRRHGCHCRDNPSFRFLDLHPELRNQIYDFAITHDTARDAAHKPAFFALTQTSQQIRSEFRSLYLSTVPIYMACDSACDFVQAFFPATQYGAINNDHVAAHLVLDNVDSMRVAIGKPSFYDNYEIQVIILGKLMSLCRDFPKLRVSFEDRGLLNKALHHILSNGLGSGSGKCVNDIVVTGLEDWPGYNYKRSV
ncbi:hypothetical protein NX059_012288 [Plenodomus lindquistii]|nr:hypothetical protein NX059_012288 [Plenodomus lindquistii]